MVSEEEIEDEEAIEAELVEEAHAPIKTQGAKLPATSSVDATALARRDPLAMYMRDVERYRLLKPEEEHALAVEYFESGDLDAAKQLVTANLRLVVKIAYEYRQAYKNILDLVQEGNIGLMQAVKKYDPFKGVKLSSYAAWWIRAYMLRFILNNHRLVKVGTTQAQRKLFFNLQKEKSRLSAMGIEPSAEKIADRLGVPEKDVVSMDMRLGSQDASLDVPVGSGDGKTVARVELLPADTQRADDLLSEAELGDQFSEAIRTFGETLGGKEKQIFDERLLTESPKTLQELGNDFGVSRERVRQLEKRLLKKLKAYLQQEVGESVIEVYE